MYKSKRKPKYYGWDIETDGLPPFVTKIHCSVFTNAKTGATKKCVKKGSTFKLAKAILERGDYLIGFNICYDLTVLFSLYGFNVLKYYKQIIDVKIILQMQHPTHTLMKLPNTRNMPKDLMYKHSLKAWSLRVLEDGQGKSDYEGGWEKFSQEMLDYNVQDVSATLALHRWSMKQSYIPPARSMLVEIFASIVYEIQTYLGWNIDEEGLRLHTEQTKAEIAMIDLQLGGIFVPFYKKVGFKATIRNASIWVKITDKTPQSILSKLTCKVAYTKKGVPKTTDCKKFKRDYGSVYLRKVNVQFLGARTEIELESFKPNSRQSIVKFMNRKYKWKPDLYTAKLSPKLEASSFRGLDYKEAKLLSERFKLSKTLTECNSITEALVNGRVHSSTEVLGTNTARTTSSKPNVAQINKTGPFRKFFRADDGWIMVGSDLSGAELTCLGHWLEPFDDCRFSDIKANSDPHQSNADLAGVSRDAAKPLMFMTLFGASGAKIGYTLWFEGCLDYNEVTVEEYEKVKKILYGRAEYIDGNGYYPIDKGMFTPINDTLIHQAIYGFQTQNKLTGGITGYNDLKHSLNEMYKGSKSLVTLDGRIMHLKSGHSALNYLLQSSNAVYTKYWYMYIIKFLTVKHKLQIGVDFKPLVSVYDEIQITCKPEYVKLVQDSFTVSAKVTNKLLDGINMECEVDTGDSWASTH